MKKQLLLLVLVFAASAALAQSGDMYSLLYREEPGYIYQISSSMQQRDGDHIIEVLVLEDLGNYLGAPYGRMYYKISPATCTVVDSLFVADTACRASLLARDPRGEGNIRAALEYHADCDSTFMRISHFPDDDLHTIPGEDVVVPVSEGLVYSGFFGSVLDCWDDLVVIYYKMQEGQVSSEHEYMARIGLDGTLKGQALLTEDPPYDIGKLKVLKESPLKYCQWGEIGDPPYYNLAVYVTDSLFHRNTVILNKVLHSEIIDDYNTAYEYMNFGSETEVVPVGGDDVLVAAKYTSDTNFDAMTQDCGVAVAKYDVRTMQMKGYAVFNDFHAYNSIGFPLGLNVMDDGTVYFLYREYYHPEESVVVVKMDLDLNVEWKRYCKTWDISMVSPLISSLVSDDGMGEEKGVAWCGFGLKAGGSNQLGWLYFFLNHDGTEGVTEGGIEVRPYDYYPNPARSELHLQYSPDVRPAKIDLYDMQGRLVQTQAQGLESLSLEGLAPGQYLMQVTLDGGKVFTDKVVKE